MAKGKVGLPKLTANQNNLSGVLSKLIEIIEVGEGQRGDALDAKVTWKDLREADLVSFAGGVNPNKPLHSQVIPPDPLGADPHKPLNLVAVPTYTAVVLEWGAAYYEGHKYTEVWRSDTPNIADAALVGQAPFVLYADVVGNDKSYYYWVRFIGTGSNNVGPYSDSVFAQTGLNVQSMLNDLTGQISTSQLAQSLNQRLDLMDDSALPDSVYSRLLNEASTRQTETTALAQNLANMLGVSGDNAAQLSELTQVNATPDFVNAIYELKTDVNGHVSGFGTINDGEQSQFFINADTFAILPQSGVFSASEIASGDIAEFKNVNSIPHRLRQWQINTNYIHEHATQEVDGVLVAGDVIAPRSLVSTQTLYKCIQSGLSGDSEPDWSGDIVYDGTVQWRRVTTHIGPIVPFVVKNNRVVMNNAFISELTADNIKAGSISADKITTIDLSAVDASLGDLTAGIMRSADNRFIVNLNEGWLRVYDEASNERVIIGKL